MDFVNHFTTGFIIGYVPTQNIPLGIVSGIIATVPDTIGEVFAHLKKDDYKMYDYLHKFHLWYLPFPQILVHILLDKFCHKPNFRWYAGKWYEYFIPKKYKEAMWVETVTWCFNVILLILIFLL